MAPKNVLIFLLVAIMAISIAEAQSGTGIIHVNGTLYCTTNGRQGSNGNATPVFPNATLQVTCTTDVVSLAEATTSNSNGAYRVIVIPRANTTVNSIISNCQIFMHTPLSTCNPAFPSTGLVSNLQFVRTVPGFLPYTLMIAAGFTLQA